MSRIEIQKSMHEYTYKSREQYETLKAYKHWHNYL